jgi:hypothetical protein
MSPGRDGRDARRVIDVATRLLVNGHRMTNSEAFRWLQANAMQRRTSLLAVADSVIAAAGRMPSLPGGRWPPLFGPPRPHSRVAQPGTAVRPTRERANAQ